MQQPASKEGRKSRLGWFGFHMFNSEVILHHIACISIIIASGHSTIMRLSYVFSMICDIYANRVGPGIVCPHSEDRSGENAAYVC